MPTVQFGSVVFERRLNTGDYSHKQATVDLSFEVHDGEDVEAAALEVAKIAVRVALTTTGEAPDPGLVTVTETKTTRTRAKKDAPAPLADPMGGPAPPTADAMGTPASANEPSPPPATGPALNAVGKPVDPTGAVPAETAPTVTQPSNAAMGGTPATAQTTDAAAAGTPALADTDLTSAVMKAMQTLAPVYGNEVAAAKCGDLIQQFGGPGGVSAIPVDKRPDFMAGLKTLA
jgi:hypothetical protein